METVDTLQRRIKTAEELHSIVRTMKALAAVNIRQLEKAAAALDDYRRTVELGLRAVLSHRSRTAVRARTAPHEVLGAIVLGSDQGMCGQLNDQVVAYALEDMGRRGVPTAARILCAVGRRAEARLDEAGQGVGQTLAVAASTSGITPLVQRLLLTIDAWHVERDVDHVVVYYSELLSRARYRPQHVDLLPVDRQWLASLERDAWPTRALPAFSLDAEELFSRLIREYLFVALYRACAESMASENASRLLAMRGAEKKIGENIDELRHLYHQERQRAVTEELLDITSGFEALADDG